MFDFTTLITDRTASDVERWRELRDKGYANMTDAEREEWNAQTMKGAYNYTDLNRVGSALNYLRDRLALANYISSTAFTARTDWTDNDITTADLTYYQNCVSVVREAMAQFETTPPAPSYVGGLNYTEANNIEQILIDVETLINNMLAARYYSGELYAGEV